MKLILSLNGNTADVDMTTMGIPVGHFTTSGSWTPTDDDVLLLVDMQVRYGTDRQSLIPWIQAVRKASKERYGQTPGLNLVRDMWQHIVSELADGNIAIERRVVYTTPLDTDTGR